LSYKITIEHTRLVDRLTPREWLQGGTDEVNTRGYGYTPQVSETKLETAKVLEVELETLDVRAAVVALLECSKP
jgi:hypothetical protein